MRYSIPLRDVPWYAYVGYGLCVLAFFGYIFTRQPWMMMIAVLMSLSASYAVRAKMQKLDDQRPDRP